MSAWYRAGTISVPNGSTTLTGTGTAFVANVAAGMMVVANNQIIGEVAAVVSNTQITLAVAYAGTTLSGASYAIANLGAVRNSLITAVQGLTALIEAAQDGALSGRFGDGTLAEPGMAFLEDLNTGFRRPAADQIGMVTGGVQRALVSSAGFNAITNLLLNGSQAFARSNILGTVSQSGGVPTGAIIERGSNANGEYVRFADGTQICAHAITLGAVTTAEGQIYGTASNTNWTFPAAFATGTVPSISGNASNLGAAWLSIFGTTSSTASVGARRAVSSATSPIALVTAFGRWF